MSGYKGKCMCGAVQFEVPCEPFAMLVCHCIDCRAWSASPVNGATAFKCDQLTVAKGEDLIKNTPFLRAIIAVGAARVVEMYSQIIQRLIWSMFVRLTWKV